MGEIGKWVQVRRSSDQWETGRRTSKTMSGTIGEETGQEMDR